MSNKIYVKHSLYSLECVYQKEANSDDLQNEIQFRRDRAVAVFFVPELPNG